MGNLSNREQEIRQTKLNIIDLETNLEYTTKKLKKKTDDVHLLAHYNLLKGLLKKQKNTLQQLELLGVTERISKTMPYDDHLAEDFDDTLAIITKKTGSLDLDNDEEEEEIDQILTDINDMVNKPKIEIETRIQEYNNVENRLEELDAFEIPKPKRNTKWFRSTDLENDKL